MSTRDIAEARLSAASVRLPWSMPNAPVLMREAAQPADGVSCRLGDASCASAQAAHLNRSATGQRSDMHQSLLRLQRDYGNHFVGHVLRRADGMEGEGGGMDAIERSIDNARGSGNSMDHRTRSGMESAFGADFSGVRIHTDHGADTLSRSLNARAFTTGSDVFFRHGEYNPGTSSGRELLAHELTHVVQQNGDGIRRKMTLSEPGDPQEVEADQMARAVMEQEHAPRADRQTGGPVDVPKEEDEKAVATQRARDSSSVQRQPEMPAASEEEKKKLQPRLDGDTLARQTEDEQPME